MTKYKESPAVYGEVLFDRFPDGVSVLGGAPFNVAWHLQGFGLSPLMMTSVGDDDAGEQVIKAMQDWGMDTCGVQVSDIYPTGQVQVSFTDGEPRYEISEDQAYDHIDAKLATSALSNTPHSLLYHGSLAIRTQHSRDTLLSLLDMGVSAFVDVNLRPPWWDIEFVQATLHTATWVKLNETELATVMDRDTIKATELQSIAQQLYNTYELTLLIVTLGKKGAIVVSQGGIVQEKPNKADNIIDTVGAGDSFSAVMIAGLLLNWPIAVSLQRALEFAGAVCQMQGATSSSHEMYDRFLGKWNV